MSCPQKHINLLFPIMLILVACSPVEPDISIKIPSLREYYPVLLQEAQKWRADAYLDSADIELFQRSSDEYDYFISAGFYSPSDDLESLGVYLFQDGTITTKTFHYEEPYTVYHHKPITENDWKIDSQEALETMLRDAGVRSLNPDENYCSFLRLERVLYLQNEPVIWFLNLWDCSVGGQYLYLDANSGKILESSEIKIVPTRFPTPTP